MTTTALIVAWWFLVVPAAPQSTATPQSTIPLALGPYPTPEMCQKAEHLVAPNDQRFWTAAEAAQWKDYNAKLAVYEAAYDAGQKRYLDRMEQLAKENPKPGKYFLRDGTTFEIWGGRDDLLVRRRSQRPSLCDKRPAQRQDGAGSQWSSDTAGLARPRLV